MQKTLYSRGSKVLRSLLLESRLKAGLTQAEIGKALKESQDWVSKVENGVRRLDVVELQLWCKAMNMSLTEFVALFEAKIESDLDRRSLRN
jgi:transcriptional regulator with XRE-family HTH domain